MENWKKRKRIHWDGNIKCIKLSEHYSFGFDTYLFRIFFSTLFLYKRKNKSWQNGSLWWKTHSFKSKIFDRHHGLRKFFKINKGYTENPTRGENYWYFYISFLPLLVLYYYDATEDLDSLELNIVKTQKQLNNHIIIMII